MIACRSCTSTDLVPVLDLGSTPLANSLLTTETLTAPEPRFPLKLVFCPSCALVQITETVPPEVLFRDYLYFSSFSDTMVSHSRTLVGELVTRRKLGAGSLVVEVASNDGYLLQHYVARGVPVLGIEPARNVAKVAQERGVRTISEFFGAELGAQLAARNELADVIHANNVMAHVADTNGFVAGFKRVLKPTGLLVVEAPSVVDMVDHTEFDTIYHEHLCYFSTHSVQALFARHGLRLVDVEHVDIHGGTLRYSAVHEDSAEAASPRVAQRLAEERQRGVHGAEFYRSFADKVHALKQHLLELLTQLKAQGKSVAAYGASAKGSTLVNFCGIDAKLLDFVVDRSTYKQGRFMPGVHLPILSPSVLLERRPDFLLLLTWNFAGEIMKQQESYVRQGGRFIVPVPTPKVHAA